MHDFWRIVYDESVEAFYHGFRLRKVLLPWAGIELNEVNVVMFKKSLLSLKKEYIKFG
jgi:hypothetical protein